MMWRKKGFIHIPVLLMITITIVLVFFISKSNIPFIVVTSTPTPTSFSLSSSTPLASLIPSPSPTPSPSQTSTPTPIPTITPTKSPTPKPTVEPVSGPPGSGYSRINQKTEVGNFLIDVVSIDTSTGAKMITDTASDGECGNECPTLPLATYVSRNNGFAAINGTYFCPQDYSECSGKKNAFDFPVYNTRLNRWINGGNLFWNDRSIVYRDGSGMHFKRDAKSFGGGLNAGIVNAPGLLENGNIVADSFPLSDKQRAKGTKGGIGIRGNIVYLVIARNVTMNEFAHVFKSLGAQSALNLDGGGSSALWFSGYKVGPGRNLPNAIIFSR